MNILSSVLDFFKPIWRKKNIDYVVHVVKATDNQQLLSRIARHSPNRIIRKMACEKILDQHILAEVAMRDMDEYVRETAIERITDEDVLIKLALRVSEPRVTALAMRRLNAIRALPLSIWVTHDFAEKVRKIPYRPHNLMMVAIANEEHFPGMCKVVVEILKEQHGRESAFFNDLSIENMDQEDARAILIQLAAQTNALFEEKMLMQRSVVPRGTVVRFHDFCRSELGLLTYAAIAAAVYALYCKIAGVAFAAFRRQTSVSLAEIILIAGLCLPAFLWLFFLWRRYRYGDKE